MKKRNEPDWSDRQREAGEKMAQSWEDFFSASEGADQASGQSPLDLEEQARLAALRARHEEELLRYPNVVGVSEGLRTRKGKPTGEPCLVVYVERKVPAEELGTDGVLPGQIEGTPVDVVEIGRPEPLPR